MIRTILTRWRGSFFTGLVVVLPAVITFAVIKWLVGTVSSLTDLLLFFLPQRWTHADAGNGPMFWYWSLAALALALVIVTLVGVLARYYIGKRMIAWLDAAMLRVPLLNKIYGPIKQVNESFSTGGKTSFKTVVLVEFPREGSHSVGFITSDQNEALDKKTGRKLVRVFIPTNAESDLRLSHPRAGGQSNQARHVRGGRHQIHHQPRRDFARSRVARQAANRLITPDSMRRDSSVRKHSTFNIQRPTPSKPSAADPLDVRR